MEQILPADTTEARTEQTPTVDSSEARITVQTLTDDLTEASIMEQTLTVDSTDVRIMDGGQH